MPNLHALKHLITELIRNHLDNVLDFGPMGYQTGFYLSVINNDSYKEVEEVLATTLEDVLVATEVPACNEVQCEWDDSLSLEGAKMEAKNLRKSFLVNNKNTLPRLIFWINLKSVFFTVGCNLYKHQRLKYGSIINTVDNKYQPYLNL